MSAVHVGLDIGGTKVLGVAVDADARVLASVRLPSEPGPDRVVDVAVAAVHALAGQLGRPLATLAGLGVGVPGLVDRRGVLAHAVNLGVGGDGLALADRLAERTGLPVSVENDVNAAALGAATVLGLDGADLAYLSIGTGLAAGLLLAGRVHRGARGGAGEVGHVSVDPDGAPCSCGQRGCLEAMASGSAIARAWPSPDGVPPAHALFRAAAAGDPRAAEVAGAVADHLAAAVQLLVLTVDVEVVVLGGGVAEVGEPLRAAVTAALRRRADRSPFLAALALPERVRLTPAGRPVAAVGAALLGPGRRAA